MRPWFLIAAFLSLIRADCPASGFYGDRRPNASTLRLVQFNAEWLFMTPCADDGCPWANTSEQEEHVSAVSAVIQELQPDIVHFCEVESCDALTAVAYDADETIDLISYLIQGKDTATGQNVGILTLIDPVKPLYRTEERIAYPIPHSTCNLKDWLFLHLLFERINPMNS
jgi:hypothetical protein